MNGIRGPSAPSPPPLSAPSGEEDMRPTLLRNYSQNLHEINKLHSMGVTGQPQPSEIHLS